MARKETLPIARFDRMEFIDTRWSYERGEHVTIMGPTGNGKTTLVYQLLRATATPQMPAVSLVMKPRDATVRKHSTAAGYRTVRSWPPPPRAPWWTPEPPGYTLWPRHNLRDHRWTREHQAHVFGEALTDTYASKGPYIVFADELYSLDRELGLGEELVGIWTKGRSMGTGLWGASQRPSHVPLWAYSQASHMFLSYDPDKRSRDRYGEIGGMDPDLIEAGVEQLDEFEWLYVRLRGRQSTICIISS